MSTVAGGRLRLAGPLLSDPAASPVLVPGATVLQAVWELAGGRGADLLPPALAPTSPTLLTVVAIAASDSPIGAFTVAQVRLSCRAGARARALAISTAADGPAASLLARAWGFGPAEGVAPGPVRLERRYDAVTVTAPGLSVGLRDPSPLGTHDVQHVVGLHPVVVADGGLRLAQVELDIDVERAERGHPVLTELDMARWGDERLHPALAVAASFVVGTLTLPALRFLLEPDRPL